MTDASKKAARLNVRARARMFEQAATTTPQEAGAAAGRRGSVDVPRPKRGESALKAGTVRQVLSQADKMLLGKEDDKAVASPSRRGSLMRGDASSSESVNRGAEGSKEDVGVVTQTTDSSGAAVAKKETKTKITEDASKKGKEGARVKGEAGADGAKSDSQKDPPPDVGGGDAKISDAKKSVVRDADGKSAAVGDLKEDETSVVSRSRTGKKAAGVEKMASRSSSSSTPATNSKSDVPETAASSSAAVSAAKTASTTTTTAAKMSTSPDKVRRRLLSPDSRKSTSSGKMKAKRKSMVDIVEAVVEAQAKGQLKIEKKVETQDAAVAADLAVKPTSGEVEASQVSSSAGVVGITPLQPNDQPISEEGGEAIPESKPPPAVGAADDNVTPVGSHRLLQQGEGQTSTTTNSDPSNCTCLLSQTSQPDRELKIDPLLREECESGASADLESSCAASDAELLTAAVGTESGAKLHPCDAAGVQQTPEAVNASDVRDAVHAQPPPVRSAFWRRLSDSGSSVSSSASDTEARGPASGNHEPSAFLNKLGLGRSRSSTSSPEPSIISEIEWPLQTQLHVAEAESSSSWKPSESHVGRPHSASGNKPPWTSEPPGRGSDLSSFNEKPAAKFVDSSWEGAHLPTGGGRPIFSLPSSALDKWRLESSLVEPLATRPGKDSRVPLAGEENPTLQELLISLQKIQEEFGKSTFDISEASLSRSRNSRQQQQQPQARPLPQENVPTESYTKGRQSRSREQPTVVGDNTNRGRSAVSSSPRRSCIKEQHGADKSQPPVYVVQNVGARVVSPVSLPHDGTKSRLRTAQSEAAAYSGSNVKEPSFVYSDDVPISQHQGPFQPLKSVQFDSSVKHLPTSESVSYVEEDTQPVTWNIGQTQRDGTVGSQSHVLTTPDETRMERRVGPIKYGVSSSSENKPSRPTNVAIKKFDFDPNVPIQVSLQAIPVKPLSPTSASKIQVRPKPELPAYFTLSRRGPFHKQGSDPSTYESGAYSDSEHPDFEKIEKILHELDFSKYRRGRSTHLTPHTKTRSLSESPRPGTRQPLPTNAVPSQYQSTSLQQQQPSNQSQAFQQVPQLVRQQAVSVEQKSPSKKSNREKLKELTAKLKPQSPSNEDEDNVYTPNLAGVKSPKVHHTFPKPAQQQKQAEDNYHQQLLLQQQLQNQQLQQQLLRQQQQLQQLQEQHLQQLQQLQKQQCDVPIPKQQVYRSASLSQVNFSEITSPQPVSNHAQPHSNDQQYYSQQYGRSLTFPRHMMASDKPMNNPPLGVETIDPSKSDFSLDSAADSVSDEGLVADSDASPSFAQTYRNVTSVSAPATPNMRQRINEPSTNVGFDVRMDGTSENRLEEAAAHLSSPDKRKRRKAYNNNAAGFQVNPYEANTKSGNGRSLTYPPQRKGSMSEDMDFTSVDSNGLKSFAASLLVGNPAMRSDPTHQLSNVSLADSHFSPSEANVEETYQDVMESVTQEPSDIDKLDDRSNGKALKKKHYSDPSGDKNEGLLDLPELIASSKSEPQLGNNKMSSQSAMSAGLRLQIVEAISETIPQASSSGSIYPFPRKAHSATLSDSDSLERDRPPQRSPQQQRRYSKKRLRGPYGEMLEEEMRKSGEKHLQKLSIAEELSFLQDLMESKPEAVQEASGPSLGCTPQPQLYPEDSWEGSQSWSPDGQDVLDKDMAAAASKRHQDTRTHVVGELYDTEQSYVDSLQILVKKYYRPLKSPENAGLVEASLVEDMFFQIPEILGHHEGFLELLRNRLENWDNKQKVGDVFVEAFTKQPVINTYTAFINNWKTAKEAIKLASQAKPAFAKFLEHMSREHKGKLTLDALLIMPVQRIPRYELLIKELLKHTQVDHPDHRLLVVAQKEVHDLAVKINRMEREAYEAEQMQQKLKELENLIDGLIDLVHPDRSFLRYDLVTMSGGLGTKKERCLFLFSDLLIITSIKRKSGTIRKASSVATSSPASLYSTLEMNKYKLLMKLSLDDLDITKSNDSNVKKALREMGQLEDDATLLNQISELVASLNCSHQNLEEVVKDMLTTVGKQLQEKHHSEAQLLYLELSVTTQEGIENLSIVFSTPDKRASWETAFTDAKQKLALATDRWPPPEFLSPLPIRKTRAGLQFTCAAPTLGLNSHNLRDVWVCNSDGYVGQVCILSLAPEPTVTSCNGVSNARILCITSVPAPVITPDSYTQRRRAYTDGKAGISISVEDVDDRSGKNGSGSNIQLDSESSEDDDEGIESQDDELRKKRGNSLPPEDMLEVDNQQPTMWLGTEDGCVLVYNCNDNIRIKKNKVKLQHSAAIHSVIYLDNKVFVSLANGNLTVYQRDSNGGWNTANPDTVSIGSASAPISRMVTVTGKLWCSCQNAVKVINTVTLVVEHSFLVSCDETRAVLCMATSGLGVWISVQNSATIKLFHATTYECLQEISVTPTVTKMLAGCDDIIRQHKVACLRVTALLTCKDLLWVGTSAGVVLNVVLPHLTSTTTKLSSSPNIAGIPQGHTGHVRFLTSVEMQPNSDFLGRSKYFNRSLKVKDGHTISRRSSISAMMGNKLLVISGGDGYEDFRNTIVGEAAGRDDSTNHLLLWQV